MTTIGGDRGAPAGRSRAPRATTRTRLTGALALAAAMTAGVTAASAGAQKPPMVRPTQVVAVLLSSHAVFASLDSRRALGTIQARRPLTSESTVLPVTARTTAKDGTRWLRVLVPGRPNGMQGWITQRGTKLTTTSWYVVVRTSVRRVLVYDHGRLDRSMPAIVGKSSTPTPAGRFFVEESIRMLPGSAGAPFALALSARSDVLQEFDGGPGQIAIHGVENLGGILGTAVSHGCIRLDTQDVSWLASRIAPGTPVTITR